MIRPGPASKDALPIPHIMPIISAVLVSVSAESNLISMHKTSTEPVLTLAQMEHMLTFTLNAVSLIAFYSLVPTCMLTEQREYAY